MLDQSFSAENFRKIFDIENRKGVYLEGVFYSDIFEVNKKIKDLNFELKALRKKKLSREKYIEEKEKIEEEKAKLKEIKEENLIEKLRMVSSRVTSSNFKIKMLVNKTKFSKPVYQTNKLIENILTLKQLQYNFRKLYKVKQANRYAIISQLKSLLDDGFPKIIFKTDIKEFYESIPHDNLFKKISDESLLTPMSIKFIRQILDEFKRLSGSVQKGIPRGIGISPYLAELYMRDVDSKIKNIQNVIYYTRYVDDIIVIFLPSIDNVTIDYKRSVEEILSAEGLVLNNEPGKTKLIDLSNREIDQDYILEYLGYKFRSGYKSKKHIQLILTISERKKKKYGERLLNAFELYRKDSKRDEKKARKIFVKRIRFLMSNTRLINNKKNVITGVYYTNNLVNRDTDFKVLDRFFLFLINKYNLSMSLKNRLLRNSFLNGFNPKCISKFSAMELNKIKKDWM